MYNNFNATTFWQLAQENLHFSWLKSQQFGGDKFHQNAEKGHSLVKVTKKNCHQKKIALKKIAVKSYS